MRKSFMFFMFAAAMGWVISKTVTKEVIKKEKQKTKYWKNECRKSRKALDDFTDRLCYLTLNEATYLFDDMDIPNDRPFLGIISPLAIDPDHDRK